MRALIDACIVIDALQSREPFFKEAQEIFLGVANKQAVYIVDNLSFSDSPFLL